MSGEPGRVLGLDYGTKRIGAALSDARRSIATPLEVYERRTSELDGRHYRTLIGEEDITAVVLGLPLHTSGREGTLAQEVRTWGAWLATIVNVPISYYDERYTSLDAEDVLRSAGVKAARRGPKRDMLAARIMLQAYLDAGCPASEPPPLPLDDKA